jgi:hypothetical protein
MNEIHACYATDQFPPFLRVDKGGMSPHHHF